MSDAIVSLIILACWIILLVYWIISARSVKATQETQGWLGGNRSPIVLLISLLLVSSLVLLAKLGVNTSALTIPIIPDSIVINVLDVVLVVGGLIVAIIARRTLAENWSLSVSLKKEHQLITTGIYSYVRHPIYMGLLLMVLGTVLVSGTLAAFISFLLIVFAIWTKLRSEENLLLKYFPDEYVSYQKRTKALIPFIW